MATNEHSLNKKTGGHHRGHLGEIKNWRHICRHRSRIWRPQRSQCGIDPTLNLLSVELTYLLRFAIFIPLEMKFLQFLGFSPK